MAQPAVGAQLLAAQPLGTQVLTSDLLYPKLPLPEAQVPSLKAAVSQPAGLMPSVVNFQLLAKGSSTSGEKASTSMLIAEKIVLTLAPRGGGVDVGAPCEPTILLDT